MVTGKYVKSLPPSIRRQCKEVTGNCTSDDEYANIVFYNEYGEEVGATYIQFESFKVTYGKPTFSLYISTFEVCKSQRGKGYGPQMLEWIEKNIPVHHIELCHREFSCDKKRSYNFWRSQGFRKPDRNYQEMVKNYK